MDVMLAVLAAGAYLVLGGIFCTWVFDAHSLAGDWLDDHVWAEPVIWLAWPVAIPVCLILVRSGGRS